MPEKKKRVPIPEDPKDNILFLSDRTCCVCRVRGKRVQIHHIDEDPSNNDPENLAVLCFDCHDQTQITGGVGRGLTAGQVIRYRDDWLKQVAAKRAVKTGKTTEPAFDAEQLRSNMEQQFAKQIAANNLFTEAKQAMAYYNWGLAEELIQKALQIHQNAEVPRFFGMKLAEALIEAFKRGYDVPPGYNFEELFSLERGQPRFYAPSINQAISWLERARKQNGLTTEATTEVLAALALMYGLSKNFAEMMNCLREVIKYNPTSVRNTFTGAIYLAILMVGCSNEQNLLESLHILGDELGIKLPISPEIVQQSVPLTDAAVYWIVMGQEHAWRDRPKPRFPTHVWMRGHDEEGTIVGQGGYRNPKDPGSQISIPPDRSYIPIDQVIKTLADDFLFICQLPFQAPYSG